MLGNSAVMMVSVFPSCGHVIWISIVKMVLMNMAAVFNVLCCATSLTRLFCFFPHNSLIFGVSLVLFSTGSWCVPAVFFGISWWLVWNCFIKYALDIVCMTFCLLKMASTMTCAGVPILLCYLSVIVIFFRIILSTIACLKKCNHCDVYAWTSVVCFNKFDLIWFDVRPILCANLQLLHVIQQHLVIIIAFILRHYYSIYLATSCRVCK